MTNFPFPFPTRTSLIHLALSQPHDIITLGLPLLLCSSSVCLAVRSIDLTRLIRRTGVLTASIASIVFRRLHRLQWPSSVSLGEARPVHAGTCHPQHHTTELVHETDPSSTSSEPPICLVVSVWLPRRIYRCRSVTVGLGSHLCP